VPCNAKRSVRVCAWGGCTNDSGKLRCHLHRLERRHRPLERRHRAVERLYCTSGESADPHRVEAAPHAGEDVSHGGEAAPLFFCTVPHEVATQCFGVVTRVSLRCGHRLSRAPMPQHTADKHCTGRQKVWNVDSILVLVGEVKKRNHFWVVQDARCKLARRARHSQHFGWC
jgi:hypothetical protein